MNAMLLLMATGCLIFGPTGFLDSRDSNRVAGLLTVLGLVLLVWGIQAPPSPA